ncbi:IS256 family transposase [Thalassotalea piscium]|uniref:Mutator family transposase n=1 Tax=Thalassotalea piscium TaxID=1230533 RepID=A0A7X0NEH0_9GAMM|nr:IS256 family transposase [Thalassotalea piscium]MBB6541925.1 transposase-like protein [Thalassotalea piscium]
MTTQFDFQEAVKALQAGKNLNGKDGVLTGLIKKLSEAALQAELEQHLANEQQPNRKNGSSTKTVKSSVGNFELDTPRDRSGSFEPQLVKKNQTSLTDEIDQKILSMFSMGMSYRDINKHIEDMYGMNVATGMISAVTDKLIPELKAWQQRPLDSHYPIVWLDAIHYKVKEDGRYISKVVYTLLGLDIHGKKEILGLHLSENEGANYWLSVLTDLNNRGVKDILIACIDGLTGFPEAIKTIFPETEIQLCIVHQIRNSMKYVASKNQKAFMADLKPVYRAPTKEAAELALDELDAKWGSSYPLVINSWRNKWHNLSAYFKYPEHIRKVIYTTNAVEAVHRQFRKLTKTKGAFPNENSLLKLLYAGILNATEKWTMPIHNWSLCLSQLAIYFEGRLDSVLDI